MNKFYMMIGLPGSGKSTYANELLQKLKMSIRGTVLLSSDKVRLALFGDEESQCDNQRVFSEMLAATKQALSVGSNVIYDATNISSKHRRALLKEISKFKCSKIAVFVATPYEECLRRNASRQRQVPEYAIKRMYMSFNVPCKNEGFDFVNIVYSEDQEFAEYITIPHFMKSISHDNPHHSASIGDHMINAYNELVKYDYDEITATATLLHDIGKPFTKTFTNYKGESTEMAHYYSHNNVGAYDVFFLNIPEQQKIDVALLIQYHMNYYTSWKDSEKAKERDRMFLGDELSAKLEILHQCDIAAH